MQFCIFRKVCHFLKSEVSANVAELIWGGGGGTRNNVH